MVAVAKCDMPLVAGGRTVTIDNQRKKLKAKRTAVRWHSGESNVRRDGGSFWMVGIIYFVGGTMVIGRRRKAWSKTNMTVE